MNHTDEKCPVCGAANPQFKTPKKVSHPKTIEELKRWYEDRHLPPKEVTRFFIGEDYKKPKAFGIYKDGDKFVVYKNKDTGARAIRYEGPDEAYAVNELYLKLKEEILNQKALNNARKNNQIVKRQKDNPFSKQNIKSGCRGCLTSGLSFLGFIVFGIIMALCEIPPVGATVISAIVTAVILVLVKALVGDMIKLIGEKALKTFIYILIGAIVFVSTYAISYSFLDTKYYNYKDTVYCKYHGSYYVYDGFDYSPVSNIDLPDNLKDYYVGGYFWDGGDWSENFVGFTDSGYYDDNFSSSSSSSDSSYDWDSGDSWDSGGSDWGSDW